MRVVRPEASEVAARVSTGGSRTEESTAGDGALGAKEEPSSEEEEGGWERSEPVLSALSAADGPEDSEVEEVSPLGRALLLMMAALEAERALLRPEAELLPLRRRDLRRDFSLT